MQLLRPYGNECVWRPCADVAAAILAAVEGGILPPGFGLESLTRRAYACLEFAGQDARLYGRRDACRHAKQIRVSTRGATTPWRESP